MALIKKTETETVNETVNDVQETSETMTTETTKDVAVKPAAGAVVVPSTGSFWMATPAILDIVAEAETNTYPRMVPSNGGQFKLQDGTQLGTWVSFYAIGEKRKRTISPNGSSGDQEAKQYFAAAYDNQLSSHGNDIEEDLEIAKSNGYPSAQITEYIDLFILVQEAENSAADIRGEIITMQLAKVAKGTWISFKSGLLMKSELGLIKFENGQPPLVKAVTQSKTNKMRQDYCTVKFQLA